MWVFITITGVLIGLVHWFVNGAYSFWKKRNVPNPSPMFPVGNVGASLIFKEHLGNTYQKIYNNFPDYQYVGVYRMFSPNVLLRNVDLIKDVMIKEFASFHDNDIEIDEKVDPLFGKNPFVLKGQKWKVVRGQITSAITTGKIKNMFSFMNNISKELVKYLNNTPEISSPDGIEAKELSAKFTTDVVAACAFGLEGKCFTDPHSEFREMGQKLFRPEGLDAIKAVLIFAVPAFARILNFSLVSKPVAAWFTSTLEQTIKYREENKIVRNDYLDLMISLKSKPGEYVFTDMDVMAQAMTFYGDGMETSATALSFTLFEISKNPGVQKKLREEVQRVLAKYDGETTYEAIQEMPYLDMVISEALRKYPPAMFLLKSCTKKFTLPPPKEGSSAAGVVIEPGMSITVPVYAIHYDPQFYPDPEKFDPERFTEEAKKDRPKCAYLPFGDGPRMCLGFRFALAQIKAAIVAISANFEMELSAKTIPKMEVDPKSLIMAKKGGIWIRYKKLSK